MFQGILVGTLEATTSAPRSAYDTLIARFHESAAHDQALAGWVAKTVAAVDSLTDFVEFEVAAVAVDAPDPDTNLEVEIVGETIVVNPHPTTPRPSRRRQDKGKSKARNESPTIPVHRRSRPQYDLALHKRKPEKVSPHILDFFFGVLMTSVRQLRPTPAGGDRLLCLDRCPDRRLV